jgi:hypothetical protein
MEEATTLVTFANTTTNYSANTIKMGIQIQNWPFKSLSNSLIVLFSATPSTSDENVCSSVDSSEDENDNLKWYTFTINGATLYPT